MINSSINCMKLKVIFCFLIVGLNVCFKTNAITIIYGPNSPGPTPVYECGGAGALCMFIPTPLFSSSTIQNENTAIDIVEIAFLRYE